MPPARGGAGADRLPGMKCPVCDVTLSISSREGVEIDFCPQCRGVWLDRGELDKILDRVAVPTPAAAAAPVAEPRYEERRPEPRYDGRDHDRDRRPEPRHDGRSEDRPRYDEKTPYGKKKKKRSFLEDLFEFD